MNKIGTFQIQDSFKLHGRGLVALGQIKDGEVKAGSKIIIHALGKDIKLIIRGVDIADSISTGEYAVALTFIYESENQKAALENLKLEEQSVGIFYEYDVPQV